MSDFKTRAREAAEVALPYLTEPGDSDFLTSFCNSFINQLREAYIDGRTAALRDEVVREMVEALKTAIEQMEHIDYLYEDKPNGPTLDIFIRPALAAYRKATEATGDGE